MLAFSFPFFVQTLSFLIEEGDSEMVELSDSDDEPAEAFMHKRRKIATTVVIDRVASSRSKRPMSEPAKMAFQSTTETQFRVASLLRRAATNMSPRSGDSRGSSGASSATSGRGKLMESTTGIKKGVKASNSIDFQKREQVRAKVENRRELKRKQEKKRQGQER